MHFQLLMTKFFFDLSKFLMVKPFSSLHLHVSLSLAEMVPLLFQLPWLINPFYFLKHAVGLSILFIFFSDPLVEVPLLVLLFLHVSLPPNSPFPWQDMLPFG